MKIVVPLAMLLKRERELVRRASEGRLLCSHRQFLVSVRGKEAIAILMCETSSPFAEFCSDPNPGTPKS